jgi:RNA polymerase sigma-54 factor
VKPALKLGLSQNLTLTPQLRQAIRLLQLSAVELEAEINELLDANPLLELVDAEPDAGGEEPEPPGDSTEPVLAGAGDGPTANGDDRGAPEVATADDDDGERAGDDASLDDWSMDEVGDAAWEARGPATDNDADGEPYGQRAAAAESLTEHLAHQLDFAPWSPRDRRIAEAIIASLDDDGYLRESNDALRELIGMEVGTVGDAEIEAVRHRLQRFDPAGVASRTLAECLAVQLAELPADTPQLALARILVAEHLEALARDGLRLAHRLAVAPADLEHAIELIRGLCPRPGQTLAAAPPEYVVPDVYAEKVDGRWRVRLNPACQPSLAVNRHYERLAAGARGEDGSYLRGRLQEARWLIKSLVTRGETLTRVANCLVRQQGAFLDYGPQAMRPLTLREVAAEIGVHESTVSRVTTRKYMHTPRGTFELKHFFSVGLATDEGGEASATAIRAMIRKLVDEENPARPWSDNAMADELKRRGIAVARRTIAKYREAMRIPSSTERCRLG